jgi:hypothetical protein
MPKSMNYYIIIIKKKMGILENLTEFNRKF